MILVPLWLQLEVVAHPPYPQENDIRLQETPLWAAKLRSTRRMMRAQCCLQGCKNPDALQRLEQGASLRHYYHHYHYYSTSTSTTTTATLTTARLRGLMQEVFAGLVYQCLHLGTVSQCRLCCSTRCTRMLNESTTCTYQKIIDELSFPLYFLQILRC